jgi:hypothetical protein
MNSITRRLIVVLGSGRSGTSMLMQALTSFGMLSSNNLIQANISNIEGFYENVEIKNIQANLITELSSFGYIPLIEGWLSDSAVNSAMIKLMRIVKESFGEFQGIYGIKDPRMNMLLPMWYRIFNQLSIVPSFVLSVRSPASVVSSMVHQYGDSPAVAELAFLARSVEALENTSADCFIAHYEDWFKKPEALAQGLLAYTGLGQTFKGEVSAVVAKTVKSNLNRASKHDYEVKNPYVLKLYEALKTCSGADFDRDALMAVVKECRRAMNGFKGWYELAHQANKKLAKIQLKLQTANAEAAKVKHLEARIKELEQESAQSALLRKQVQRLFKQMEWIEMQNVDAAQPVPISQ